MNIEIKLKHTELSAKDRIITPAVEDETEKVMEPNNQYERDENADPDNMNGGENNASERLFYLHDREANLEFRSNYIKTTKYTLITFLPLSLLTQFARLANIYFLIVAILASIPEISSLTPATSITPLVGVLALSMLREGIEDYYRYRSDRQSNSQKVSRLDSEGEWEEVCAKDLRVGDIVIIQGDKTFPADVILLKSSNTTKAYIQTSSLDGEKNLKKRFVPKDLEKLTKPDEEQAWVLGGKCTTLPPNKDLYTFTGKLDINGKIYPLDTEQLMLKDSKLKNTEWIIGTVGFTGKETKVMQNSQKGRIKTSNLEKRLNKIILVLFAIQLSLCL